MASPIIVTMDGTLLNWTKQVGDSVKAGEVLAEVEADKATVEVEAPANGIFSAKSVEPGAALTAGQVIGTVGAAEASASPAAQATVAIAAARQTGTHVIASLSNGTPAAAQATVALTAARQAGEQIIETLDNGSVGVLPDGVKASPIARRMAMERNIDLRQVAGSGPGGRIVREDVEHYQPIAPVAPVAAPAAAVVAPVVVAAPAAVAPVAHSIAAPTRKTPEAGADVELIDLTTVRKRIAAVTVESKQNHPHFYITIEVDMGPALALRKQINADLPDAAKVTVNDIVVKAVALTLRQFPNLNSHFYGDKIARYKRINVGIAVAQPNNGLIYVVAKDADKVALGTLAQTNKEMIARARDGKVKADDISGATFSTSNLGAYEVESFSAIISPPEAGIVAIGSAKKVPVVLPDGSIGVGERMKATISVDHRVSDGVEGSQFMQAFKKLLESPLRLLV